MTLRRLSALDVGFLSLETDTAPLHVGALVVLEGPPPDADDLDADLARRASAAPACRRRVSRNPWSVRRPVWVDDPGFDPRSQLHGESLPSHADREALRRRVVELMSARLDTSRPLWEVRRIEGLPDGRWALLVKAHHTLIDGVSGAGLLSTLLAPQAPAGPRPPTPILIRAPVRERMRRLRRGARAVAVPDLPPNVLNGPLGASRTWDWCEVAMADLRQVGSSRGCTVNDVYLAALSGGLRSVLVERSALEPDTRVRTLVPVSMRRAPTDDRAGNLDAAFFVELPVHRASVLDMLDDVAAQSARAKRDAVPLATEELLRAGDLVPAPLLDRAARAYARRGQRRVNLVATDVRGPGAALQLCGRRVQEIVPCVPLALDVRVTSALMSYVDRAAVSFTVDRSVTSDAESVVRAFERALDELVRGSR